jgi:hypothetical protein
VDVIEVLSMLRLATVVASKAAWAREKATLDGIVWASHGDPEADIEVLGIWACLFCQARVGTSEISESLQAHVVVVVVVV